MVQYLQFKVPEMAIEVTLRNQTFDDWSTLLVASHLWGSNVILQMRSQFAAH